MKTSPGLVLAALLAGFPLAPARADDPAAARLPKGLEGVAFEQRLGNRIPLDLAFTDELGRQVALADFVRQRPVILTLNYFQCPMLCTLELNALVSSLRALSFAPGQDFEIVTVSIDPNEGADLAAAKKAEYLKSYARPGAESAWHFLTGNESSIRALTDAVGFRYRYDAAARQFAHAAGIVVLTPDGRASRYFFGVEFAPRDIRLALVESSAGKIGSLADRVMLFCYHYDPTEARYGLAALNAVRAGGVATVAALIAFVILGNRAGARGSPGRSRREVAHGV